MTIVIETIQYLTIIFQIIIIAVFFEVLKQITETIVNNENNVFRFWKQYIQQWQKTIYKYL